MRLCPANQCEARSSNFFCNVFFSQGIQVLRSSWRGDRKPRSFKFNRACMKKQQASLSFSNSTFHPSKHKERINKFTPDLVQWRRETNAHIFGNKSLQSKRWHVDLVGGSFRRKISTSKNASQCTPEKKTRSLRDLGFFSFAQAVGYKIPVCVLLVSHLERNGVAAIILVDVPLPQPQDELSLEVVEETKRKRR